MSEQRAFVGLGSNLRSPVGQILLAFDELAALHGSRLVSRSSLYKTAPVGYADQPDFVNAVAELWTLLSADALLQALLEIERRHGRVREIPNGPRTLDLDVLLFGDHQVRCEWLHVPHPRAHQRAFVLHPLIEVAPDIDIPGRGPAKNWLAQCADQPISRIAEESTLRRALGTFVEMT